MYKDVQLLIDNQVYTDVTFSAPPGNTTARTIVRNVLQFQNNYTPCNDWVSTVSIFGLY